ncbi:hypothetical protein DyAD56_07800 [Dyella sp. AD56]|uniref:hypothetical protein n=1 Tax=Dyella sp. AD56 TaxID=1528744 RepID=UPI000C8548C7|nr:hypothetical protein [Dyella sp. AD56]PMQ05790.1 hypothetical protein DyAD56_07800 [Dyella sp. AD56]
MEFFEVRPEVPGGLGPHTSMDRSTHPPEVDVLHYVFDGWSGDVLLTSFPCYLVTDDAKCELQRTGATGASFGSVEVGTSETFVELFAGKALPPFSWLQVKGVPGVDDFGIAPNLRLIVSERVLDVFKSLQLVEARVNLYAETG